jgi:hypothetical protein
MKAAGTGKAAGAGQTAGGARQKPAPAKGANKPASAKGANKPATAKGASKSAVPKGADEPVLIDSLPMARYGFVVHGWLANRARISVKGVVYARRGLYYQAKARVLDSILKEIPALELDEDPIGLKMLDGKRCTPPADLSLLGRPKPQNVK